jgi:predicted acetyltransferase
VTRPDAPQLVQPAAALWAPFVEALRECRVDSDRADIWLGLRSAAPDAPQWGEEVLADVDRFAAFVDSQVRAAAEDAPRPAGYVPVTELWWVAEGRLIGRVSIRHRLTPFLREVGGHIGYVVRPSARRRGHATAMLAAALPHAAALGHEQVLVTCDHDNVGSRKAIEANGGLAEDRRGDKLRYWIATGIQAWAPKEAAGTNPAPPSATAMISQGSISIGADPMIVEPGACAAVAVNCCWNASRSAAEAKT